MIDEKLKNELENAYAESVAEYARDAKKLTRSIPHIRKRDYAAFAAVFNTLENKEFVMPTREQFEAIPSKELEESIQMLSSGEVAPTDLRKSRFIKAEANGATAAYYLQEELDSADHVTLSMIRFRKAPKGWKKQGAAYSYSFAKSSDEENEKTIREQLKTNPEFRL